MIFVNYDGGGYWFFSHSAWNGKQETIQKTKYMMNT